MLRRNLIPRHRCLLPHGGGSIRTLSFASSYQPRRPPPSPPPPPFQPIPTSPPSSTTPRGGGASATWSPSSPSPPPPPRPYNPMASYLARACGFSFDEAAAAAELLSGNKSPRNPNSSSSSNLRGKSPLATQIGWLVSSAPPPPGGKHGATEDVGFCGRTLAQLMLLDPGVQTAADAARKIGFWCALFRAEADLLQALESNTRAPASFSAKETTVRKMFLLLECGVPNRELREVLRKDSEVVSRSVASLEALIKRVEELGVARGRRAAYRYALDAIAALSQRKLEAKLGVHKAPQAVGTAFGFSNASPRNAGKAVDVPFGEDGIEASSAAAPSIALSLSLEKKVMPPYYVLQILKSKNDFPGENRASYLLRMCKKARFWSNSYAGMNREFQSFMKLISLLVRGRIAA